MINATWQVLVELAPWLLLGTFLSGLLHVLLPAGMIHQNLRGRWGVIKAVILGVPLPLCSCGVIPAGVGLKKDGASDGAAIGFLISTPQTGVDSILVSASMLGWPFALFKVFSAAVTGLVGGFLADRVSDEATGSTASSVQAESGSRNPVRELWDHSIEVVRSIWLWLLIGVLVSAAINTFVPASVFQQISEWGSLSSSLAALLISLPLYVCATASVPIAWSFVSNGLPAGAALVFLMAGPATNVATIGAIYRTFGGRTTVVYLLTIIVGSIGFAFLFDTLIDQTWMADAATHHSHMTWWGQGSAILLVVLLGWFAVDDLRRWVGSHQNRVPEDGLRVGVTGMTCDGCASRLESALRSTEGVRSASVRFKQAEAIVEGDVARQRVCEVIREAGFQPDESEELSADEPATVELE